MNLGRPTLKHVRLATSYTMYIRKYIPGLQECYQPGGEKTVKLSASISKRCY